MATLGRIGSLLHSLCLGTPASSDFTFRFISRFGAVVATHTGCSTGWAQRCSESCFLEVFVTALRGLQGTSSACPTISSSDSPPHTCHVRYRWPLFHGRVEVEDLDVVTLPSDRCFLRASVISATRFVLDRAVRHWAQWPQATAMA